MKNRSASNRTHRIGFVRIRDFTLPRKRAYNTYCMKLISVTEILSENLRPAIAIDEHGVITFANRAFEKAYGWSPDELKGEVITRIMPPHMRDAHNFGFSRFLTTEAARILNQPLSLPVYCKDGTTVDAEHFITGEKVDSKWRFAATITPKPKGA